MQKYKYSIVRTDKTEAEDVFLNVLPGKSLAGEFNAVVVDSQSKKLTEIKGKDWNAFETKVNAYFNKLGQIKSFIEIKEVDPVIKTWLKNYVDPKKIKENKILDPIKASLAAKKLIA